jgi:hypothetical protein
VIVSGARLDLKGVESAWRGRYGRWKRAAAGTNRVVRRI